MRNVLGDDVLPSLAIIVQDCVWHSSPWRPQTPVSDGVVMMIGTIQQNAMIILDRTLEKMRSAWIGLIIITHLKNSINLRQTLKNYLEITCKSWQLECWAMWQLCCHKIWLEKFGRPSHLLHWVAILCNETCHSDLTNQLSVDNAIYIPLKFIDGHSYLIDFLKPDINLPLFESCRKDG